MEFKLCLQKKNGYGYGRRRMNTRTGMAQREDVIRRTVYVSDIDHQVKKRGLVLLLTGLLPLSLFYFSNSVSSFV